MEKSNCVVNHNGTLGRFRARIEPAGTVNKREDISKVVKHSEACKIANMPSS